MEYILIPTESKSETAFFLSLLKKMKKEMSTLCVSEIEDIAFLRAMDDVNENEKGSLDKVKNHLKKVIAGK